MWTQPREWTSSVYLVDVVTGIESETIAPLVAFVGAGTTLLLRPELPPVLSPLTARPRPFQ